MPTTITIKPGDTLSGLGASYGMDWRTIWAANPNIKDPNKIYAGQPLVIPDKGTTQQTGTLANTLPKTGNQLPAPVVTPQAPSLPAAQPLALPQASNEPTTTGAGQMTLLKLALTNAARIAQTAGIKSGLQATFSGMNAAGGYSPEKASGSMVGNIIDFVEGQTTQPIKNELDNMTTMVDSIAKEQETLKAQQDKLRDDARSQISQAVSSDMWNSMTDAQRKQLWTAAGYVGDPVTSKSTNTAAYHTTDADGNVVNVVYDKTTGKIISQESLGQVGKGFKDTGTTAAADKEQKRVQEFQADAADLAQQMDAGKMTWKTAWDTLHLKYQDMLSKMASPDAATKLIDLSLGYERREKYDVK